MKIMCSMCTAKRMIPRGSYGTQFESFLLVSTKTGNKTLKINVKSHQMSAWNDVREQHERAIDMLTTGMLARDVAQHFKCHESTSPLLNTFQQTGNVLDRSGSGRPHKSTPWEDRYLTTSSQRNRFLSSRKLGHLLRNATGTRVCDRTVRNRLHAARLKVCCPHVSNPLT